MASLETPFEFGATYWRILPQPEKVAVPCPVCAGQKRVEVILGTGEHVWVECEGCGCGYDGPRGYIEQYEHRPRVEPFTIDSLHSKRGDEWRVLSDVGESAFFHDLYPSEAAAMEQAAAKAAAQHEANMESRRQSKAYRSKQVGWRVRYHRECIADLERQLEWHRSKVQPKA